ncbi:PAS domain-containing hybrid sensor histidine kinase/response regulator [uncultured Thiodictyon sp.]|jgi:PAS domain S-box-containing protein|uniref:PAS domain-containing hybrid sensor histidine kinase/response regulator n=1 Tax=uncultured Thiodictyon sp. TaxID=1846217 RepID=UPI0025D6B703|nr:PAS domain-containing hybrid sensor histidine kinase/response regulator [uncultured Thiodictyon sp.]
MSDQAPDCNRLKTRISDLERQVARLSVVHQELIDTRDRLDRELERFAGMQSYNTRAIAVRDPGQFAAITAEAVLELFELEFALLWPTAPDGTPADAPTAALGIAPDAIPGAALRELIATERFRRSRTSWWGPADPPPAAPAGAHQLVISACAGPSGVSFALVIGGVAAGDRDHYRGLVTAHLESFAVFAQQIGALLQNRSDQATIERQMQQLRLEQERLNMAVEGSNAGLWDWDLETNRVHLSPRWKAMLGHGPEEVQDTFAEWEARVHPDDLGPSRERVRAHLIGVTEIYENVHRLRHKDGHYLWIMARGRALRTAAGRPYRMVGIHLDVTEQRRAREQAEAANRAKSEFLATVSHEILTPMNGVLGMLESLQHSGPTPEQAPHLATARRSAEHLLEIINDILVLSTIEAGRFAAETNPFAPGPVLTAAADAFRDAMAAKGLDYRVDLAAALPDCLLGDPACLTRILRNLVGNALKFTPAGTVTVALGGRPLPDGRFELALTVRDTGIGMAPETQARVFSPFTQADGGTTRAYGGAGLGLVICRRLLDQMGGRIWMQSEPGRGSELQVRLPLDPGSAQAPEPQPRPRARRALLVEDNLVNQKVARGTLAGLGLEVLVADDGRQALEIFAQGGIDIVLMDIQMPVMDGYEATRRLRALEAERAWPRTPVLAVSANTSAEDRDRCLAADMDAFVAKPTNAAGFKAALVRWVEI